MEESNRNLLDVDDDVLLDVLARVGTRDVCRVSCCCSRLQAIVAEEGPGCVWEVCSQAWLDQQVAAWGQGGWENARHLSAAGAAQSSATTIRGRGAGGRDAATEAGHGSPRGGGGARPVQVGRAQGVEQAVKPWTAQAAATALGLSARQLAVGMEQLHHSPVGVWWLTSAMESPLRRICPGMAIVAVTDTRGPGTVCGTPTYALTAHSMEWSEGMGGRYSRTDKQLFTIQLAGDAHSSTPTCIPDASKGHAARGYGDNAQHTPAGTALQGVSTAADATQEEVQAGMSHAPTAFPSPSISSGGDQRVVVAPSIQLVEGLLRVVHEELHTGGAPDDVTHTWSPEASASLAWGDGGAVMLLHVTLSWPAGTPPALAVLLGGYSPGRPAAISGVSNLFAQASSLLQDLLTGRTGDAADGKERYNTLPVSKTFTFRFARTLGPLCPGLPHPPFMATPPEPSQPVRPEPLAGGAVAAPAAIDSTAETAASNNSGSATSSSVQGGASAGEMTHPEVAEHTGTSAHAAGALAAVPATLLTPTPPPAPVAVAGLGADGVLSALMRMQGLWTAEYSSHGPEVVQVRVCVDEAGERRATLCEGECPITGVRVEGLKVLGDVNVPSGRLTFAAQANAPPVVGRYDGRDLDTGARDGRPIVAFAAVGLGLVLLSARPVIARLRGFGQINAIPGRWEPAWEPLELILYEGQGGCLDEGMFSVLWRDNTSMYMHIMDFIPFPMANPCPGWVPCPLGAWGVHGPRSFHGLVVMGGLPGVGLGAGGGEDGVDEDEGDGTGSTSDESDGDLGAQIQEGVDFNEVD